MCPQNVTVFARKLRLSIHPDIINKDVPEDRLRAEGWHNVELTIADFVQWTGIGFPNISWAVTSRPPTWMPAQP